MPIETRKNGSHQIVRAHATNTDQSTCQENFVSVTKPQHEMLEGPFSQSKNDILRPIEVLSSNSSGSWIQRIGLFKNRGSGDDNEGVFNEQPDSPKTVYHGSIMESANSPKFMKAPPKMMSRNRSFLTHSSQGTKDSLYDFHDSEWTPPDSSYGAAIPIAGSIPKHIRRAIEVTLIGLALIGLAFLIVTASIRVSEEVNKNRDNVDPNSEYDGGTGLDDEMNNDASAYQDDYFDDTFARVEGDSGLYDDYFDDHDQNEDLNNNDYGYYSYYDDYYRKADDYFHNGN